MAKRALVLGAEIHNLTGVHNDTDRIAALLARRGFSRIEICREKTGTREGMLEGYDRLIRDSAPGDAAVVYYSGHGSLVYNQDPEGPAQFQCIVPTDIDDSTDDDFRGISSWELSIKQAELTVKTRNVTVLLDCCHSTQMSRDGAVRHAVARALPHPIRLGVGPYLAALRIQQSRGMELLDPLANPHAVRVVACGLAECSFEYTRDDGTRTGVFTDALISILTEIGDAQVSWHAVGAAIRQRVLLQFPYQRPDVEGPVRRRLFSLSEVDARDMVPIVARGGRFALMAGRLSGVSPGDVYGVMPLAVDAYSEDRAVAKVSVESVSATTADATLVAWKNRHTALPTDAMAVPTALAAERRPVRVEATAPEREAIERALATSLTLRPAGPDEVDAVLATLRLAAGQLTIEDALGPLFPPTRYPDELAGTIRNLVNIGIAHGVRELAGEHGVAASEVSIEWGVVVDGQMLPMPPAGSSLGLGDMLYLKIGARSQRRLYAHVFNIGLRHRIASLTPEAPAGVLLDPGTRDYVVAEGTRSGYVRGFCLSWPEGLPRDLPRTDELIVIVTTSKTDLQVLVTHEFLPQGNPRGRSELVDLLGQLSDGAPRDVTGGKAPGEDYLVARLSYLLHPRASAMGGLAFAIDEEPLNQRGARAPHAWVRPGIDMVTRSGAAAPPRAAVPGAVAIRLGDLVVERNRALGSADIRVDALVCTLAGPGDSPYTVQTMRFPRIRDGERLPLDNALLYHGSVREFVDICLWVSRDTANSRALAELFAEKATSADFKDAATALLVAAGVVAVPWVGAVGASAVLARIAYDLVLGATGASIGLYRTSFLAGEAFGAGRHPAQGLHRAQEFAFSLVIDPVG